MMIMMSDNDDDDNNDKLTFSDNQETKKQDHGVTGEDEVAAIFLRKHFDSTLNFKREWFGGNTRSYREIKIIMLLIIMINNR